MSAEGMLKTPLVIKGKKSVQTEKQVKDACEYYEKQKVPERYISLWNEDDIQILFRKFINIK